MANQDQSSSRLLLIREQLKGISSDPNDNPECVICREFLSDTYQTYCGCQYCHTCISEYLSKGAKYCRGNKLECKQELLILGKNVVSNPLLNKQVLKAKVICPKELCGRNSKLTPTEDQLSMGSNNYVECPYLTIGCDSVNVPKGEIITHIHNDALPHTRLLIDLIHNLKNEFCALKGKVEEKENIIEAMLQELCDKGTQAYIQQQEIETLKKGLELSERLTSNQQHVIEALRKEIKEATKSNNDIRTSISKLSTAIDQINLRTNMMGEIYMLVYQFERLTKTTIEILSPIFYSHPNGYKLRLSVYPGGIYGGIDTHLSVYIIICKGEYDDLLSWPCKYIFTVAMVDQLRQGVTHNTKILSHDTVPDNCRCVYNKPIMVDNKGYGYDKFISHSELISKKGLVVDNCIIIKCTASSPFK